MPTSGRSEVSLVSSALYRGGYLFSIKILLNKIPTNPACATPEWNFFLFEYLNRIFMILFIIFQ